MRLLGDDATRTVCGHGQVDLERAAFSDDARVVLYGEDELATDHFAVYRIPIPEPFQTERGERRIRVTLAYDRPFAIRALNMRAWDELPAPSGLRG